MKKIFITFLLLSLIVSGCSFGKKNQPQIIPKTSQNEQQVKPAEKPIEQSDEYIVGLNAPVKGLREWVDRYKPYEGVYVQKMDKYRVVLISQGEKFSKGYSVSVDKVTKENDRWVIETSIVKPETEDYSGKSVYPYEVVSILDDNKPVEVVKSKPSNSDMSLQTIEIPEGRQLAVSKNFIVLTPAEGDKITSPVRIRGKARVFEAAFRIGIEDGHNRLADRSMMSSQGAPGWGDFDVNLPFETPTNPNGTIIFSYENMANGTIIEELVLPVKF